MKSKKVKSRVLHLEWNNFLQQYRQGVDLTESSFAEKDLEVLTTETWASSVPSWQGKPTTPWAVLECSQQIKESDYSRLLGPCEALPGLLCPVLGPLGARKILTYWSESSRGHPEAQKAGAFARLKEMALFSLTKRRLRGVLIAIYNYLVRHYREDQAKLFSEVSTKIDWKIINTSWNTRCSDQTSLKKDNFFNHKGDRTLEQIAQRGWGISILEDAQDLTKPALSNLV